MNGEMALQGPSRYPLAWWTHSCCLQREPTAARSGVRRALEEGTTKCAQTTEYQGHGHARGQESRVVSALCTTSKPYVLVRRVSNDKATSRVAPDTPRDEEIRGWSLQARLRARQRAREVPRGPPCRGWSRQPAAKPPRTRKWPICFSLRSSAGSPDHRSEELLPPTGTNDSTLNRQGSGDPGPFRGRCCAEMCY